MQVCPYRLRKFMDEWIDCSESQQPPRQIEPPIDPAVQSA